MELKATKENVPGPGHYKVDLNNHIKGGYISNKIYKSFNGNNLGPSYYNVEHYNP